MDADTLGGPCYFLYHPKLSLPLPYVSPPPPPPPLGFSYSHNLLLYMLNSFHKCNQA